MTTDPSQATNEALAAALVEVERHVGASGWDQPSRLFALVRTQNLVDAEPHLASQLTVTAPDALSSIEQEGFHAGEDLVRTLAGIVWPPTVDGCALACERAFLPAGQESDIPADPAAAMDYVSHHPARLDIRIVAGVLRTGERFSVGRLASNPDDLLGAADLTPQLTDALAATLLPDPELTTEESS